MGVIETFIGEVKREMADHAAASLLRPRRDNPPQMLEDAGIYQGLNKALEILDTIIRDNQDGR